MSHPTPTPPNPSTPADDSQPKTPSRGRAWLFWLIVVYGALMVGGGGAVRWVSEGWWLTAYLTYVPPLLFGAPLLLAGLALLFRRDRRTRYAWLIVSLLWAGPGMGLSLPLGRRAARPDDFTLRVLCWNIHGATYGRDLVDQALRESDADVIILQETSGYGLEHETLKSLEADFADWETLNGQDVFIASRFPRDDSPVPEPVRGSPFSVAYLRVRTPAGPVRLMGLHLPTPTHALVVAAKRPRSLQPLRRRVAERTEQARLTLEALAAEDTPAILAGDLNTPPFGRLYRGIARRYRSAFAVAGLGWGHTFHSRAPVLRIDHVFVSDHWRVNACRVATLPGSDHRAIIADLSLPTSRE